MRGSKTGSNPTSQFTVPKYDVKVICCQGPLFRLPLLGGRILSRHFCPLSGKYPSEGTLAPSDGLPPQDGTWGPLPARVPVNCEDIGDWNGAVL